MLVEGQYSLFSPDHDKLAGGSKRAVDLLDNRGAQAPQEIANATATEALAAQPTVNEGALVTMTDDLAVLREKPFCDAVARFEELLLQGGPAWLIGAGCSKCAGLPLTDRLTSLALAGEELNATSKEILEAIKIRFAGASAAHIEDYLSELIDLLAIADRRVERGATSKGIELDGRQYCAKQLREAADQIKIAIAAQINKKEIRIDTHRAFVAAVHRPPRPGKTDTERVADYLVLNYDTSIEDALALERIPFSDGMDGGVTGWWSPRTFDRERLEARVLKLHGSIDWFEVLDDPLPRRIAASVRKGWPEERILIWPASTKYRETQRDPYAQLAERARRALRPADKTQRTLFICGYGFGDTHINIEVDRAIRESSENLTVVAFTSEAEPSGQLKRWREDKETREQVLIFARRGFFHAGREILAEHDLGWWKFEVLARLLGGER